MQTKQTSRRRRHANGQSSISASFAFQILQSTVKAKRFLLAIALPLMMLCAPEWVPAQGLGSNFIWSTADTTSTAAGRDTTYSLTQRWEDVTLWFMDGDGWVKVSSDTAIFNKEWIYLHEGIGLNVGPQTRLRRLKYRNTDSTTLVQLFMIGYKKVQQP